MKKLVVLVGVLALLILGPSAWADITLNFSTAAPGLTADTPVGIGVIGFNDVKFTNTTQQYGSYGVNFYSGAISTLKTTYSWFPNYTFHDSVGNTVTTFMGPTFETPTDWLNRQNDTQTVYPPGVTPPSGFLGFDKNDTSTPAIDSGTVMKFNSPVYSLSLQLSRPGRNAGNIAEVYIYLFNSAGGTQPVASKLQFTVYTGGTPSTPEWVTYNSPPGGAFDVVVIYSSDRFMCDNLFASSNPASGLSNLEAPVLVSPVTGITAQNNPNEITLAWDPVPGADTYYVTWAYRQTIKDQWNAPTTSSAISGNGNTSYKFDAPSGDGEYEWAVIAHDSTATHLDSAPSSTRTFFFESALTPPVPKLLSPQQNAEFYNVPRTTTLAWQQAPGASGYTVDLWYKSGTTWIEDATDSFPVTVTGQQTSYYTFTFTLPGGLTKGPIECEWRVEATGETTNSGYSGWRTFEFEN